MEPPNFLSDKSVHHKKFVKTFDETNAPTLSSITCEMGESLPNSSKKKRKKLFKEKIEFERPEVPVEISLESASIYDNSLLKKKKRVKEFYNDLRTNMGFTISENSDALYQESDYQLHYAEFASKYKSSEKKNKEKAEVDNNKAQIADKYLDNTIYSNVTEDCNYKKKKKKKKHSASLGNENVDNDNIDSDSVEEVVNSGVTQESKVKNKHKKTETDNSQTQIVEGDLPYFLSSNETEDCGYKGKRKKKKHLAKLENENDNDNAVELGIVYSSVAKGRRIMKEYKEKVETDNSRAQIADKDSNSTIGSNVTQDCDYKRKKKKKKYIVELENENFDNDSTNSNSTEELNSSHVTNNTVSMFGNQKRYGIKKEHILNDEFENNDASVKNVINLSQNPSPRPVNMAKEIFPVCKKLQEFETVENVTQNEDTDFDIFLNLNASETVNVTGDCEKKQKSLAASELEHGIVSVKSPKDSAYKMKNLKKKNRKVVNDAEFSLSDETRNDTVVENTNNPAYENKTPEKQFSSKLDSSQTPSDFDVMRTPSYIVPVLDDEKDPVDFTVPVLHASESVSPLTKEERASFESMGIKIKDGKWLNSEDDILRRNYNEFCRNFKINDPYVLLGVGKNRRSAEVVRFLKAKHFYVRLGKDLKNRTLNSIYTRARTLFHPLREGGKFTPEDTTVLKAAYNLYGNNWSQIGAMLDKNASAVRASFRWNQKPVNKGRWTPEEEENLINAIKTVAKTSEISPSLIKKISWEKVAELVPTRNFSQCRLHWGEYMAWSPEVTQRTTWNGSKDQQLLEVIKSKHLTNESQIDWEDIHKSFEDAAPSYMFLQKRYRRLKSEGNIHILKSLFEKQ